MPTETTRYRAIPRGWLDNWGQQINLPTVTVVETEKQPRPTGLVDQTGTPLYRIPDEVPFGFRGKL